MSDKKSKQKIVESFVSKYKNDLEFLKILQETTSTYIEKYKYIDKENKLKDIIPDATIRIITIDEHEDIQDSRFSHYIELEYNNNNIEIYKQIQYNTHTDTTLEEFYISVNKKNICCEYDALNYEINKQIEDKTLDIHKNDHISNENIYKLLHFFKLSDF